MLHRSPLGVWQVCTSVDSKKKHRPLDAGAAREEEGLWRALGRGDTSRLVVFLSLRRVLRAVLRVLASRVVESRDVVDRGVAELFGDDRGGA